MYARTTQTERQTERIVSEYKRELSKTRDALERTRIDLERTRNDLEETVKMAELLCDVNRRLGTVTDYLLKQQGRLDDKDCNSFEAMFNILLKQAETRGDEPDVDQGSKSDRQGEAEQPAGVIALG
jgi:hypothetical protein